MTKNGLARRLPQFLDDAEAARIARRDAPGMVVQAARRGVVLVESIPHLALIHDSEPEARPEGYDTVLDVFEVWELTREVCGALEFQMEGNFTFRQLGEKLLGCIDHADQVLTLRDWRARMVRAVSVELEANPGSAGRVKHLLGMLKLVLIDEYSGTVSELDLKRLHGQMSTSAQLCAGRFGDDMRFCMTRLGDELETKKNPAAKCKRWPRW